MTTETAQEWTDLRADLEHAMGALGDAQGELDAATRDVGDLEDTLVERDMQAAGLRSGLEAVVDDLTRRIDHLVWVESDAAETPAEAALRAIRDDLLGLLP